MSLSWCCWLGWTSRQGSRRWSLPLKIAHSAKWFISYINDVSASSNSITQRIEERQEEMVKSSTPCCWFVYRNHSYYNFCLRYDAEVIDVLRCRDWTRGSRTFTHPSCVVTFQKLPRMEEEQNDTWLVHPSHHALPRELSIYYVRTLRYGEKSCQPMWKLCDLVSA